MLAKAGYSTDLGAKSSGEVESGRGRAEYIRCATCGLSYRTSRSEAQVHNYEKCGSDHHPAKSRINAQAEANTDPNSGVFSWKQARISQVITGTTATNALRDRLSFLRPKYHLPPRRLGSSDLEPDYICEQERLSFQRRPGLEVEKRGYWKGRSGSGVAVEFQGNEHSAA